MATAAGRRCHTAYAAKLVANKVPIPAASMAFAVTR
jgi:hypothetical protein